MKTFLVFMFFGLIAWNARSQEPSVVIQPRHYVCYRASGPITIDGLMTEPDWQLAEWTEYFGDIEGSLKPEPRLKTRAKMLWDDKYLYVLAQLEEPNVWAYLTERESVIFYDPDFEVFIDPDGDTHHYLEYEMNAMNTQWDLMLLKPYRDDVVNNVAIDNWNYNGMKSAVYVDGTINDPKDTDKGWTVEIAFPLDAMAEVSSTGKNPVPGEQYRIDFSRVEWLTDLVDGKYKRRSQLQDGKEKFLPEDNWVWSPQGVVNMHQPETWGYLQFSGKPAGRGTDSYVENPDNAVKWALRLLYYRQKAYFEKNSVYTTDPGKLGLADYKLNNSVISPSIRLTQTLYEASLPSADGKGTWHITQDGRVWKTPN